MSPGRLFSTRTSAHPATRRSTSGPCGWRRSMAADRRPRPSPTPMPARVSSMLMRLRSRTRRSVHKRRKVLLGPPTILFGSTQDRYEVRRPDLLETFELCANGCLVADDRDVTGPFDPFTIEHGSVHGDLSVASQLFLCLRPTVGLVISDDRRQGDDHPWSATSGLRRTAAQERNDLFFEGTRARAPRDRPVGQATSELQHPWLQSSEENGRLRRTEDSELGTTGQELALDVDVLIPEQREQDRQVLTHVTCRPVVGETVGALDRHLV